MNLYKALCCTIFLFSQSYTSDYWFKITPLENILYAHPEIQYISCMKKNTMSFKIPPFHGGENAHPTEITFDETFVLKVPNGKTYSHFGWFIIDNMFPEELIWKKMPWNLIFVDPIDNCNFKKISGRVAVLGQLAYFNYYHWIHDVLCKLALLELFNIEYDYLYVPANSKFMSETLQLWVIDEHKIIQPFDDTYAIQADELIIPSMVNNYDSKSNIRTCFSAYSNQLLIKYVRNKLLRNALKYKINKNFNKRFYTSRKDSSLRKILNESELIDLFKKYNIDSYNLSDLTIIEQIHLFNNAEIVFNMSKEIN